MNNSNLNKLQEDMVINLTNSKGKYHTWKINDLKLDDDIFEDADSEDYDSGNIDNDKKTRHVTDSNSKETLEHNDNESMISDSILTSEAKSIIVSGSNNYSIDRDRASNQFRG